MRMFNTPRLILWAIVMALVTTALATNAQAGFFSFSHKDTSGMKGKTLYTQENMYSLKGKVVTWVNYHVDTLIPVNTPVVINYVGGSSMSFTIKATGQKLRLKNSRHSGLDGEAWTKRHFGPNRVDLHKFSRLEQEAIAAAEVRKGMSKAAVLVAYGYPPAHRTPSLKANRWLYWINRWNKVAVVFDDYGHVTQIIN